MLNNAAIARKTSARIFAVSTKSPVSKRTLLFATAFVVLWLAVVFALALDQWRLPQVPRAAFPTAFSAERAVAHLSVIADQPHPVGSPQSAKVREYIVGELSKLG